MKNRVKLSKLLPVLSQDVAAHVREVVADVENAVVIRKARAGTSNEFTFAEGERAAIRYVSTRDVDRDGEILDPAGAVLDDYRKAPVVLWAHNYAEPPIGSDEWIKADDRGLLAKTRYATTPLADEVWTLVKEGHLRTSSVGFIPLEMVDSGGPGWAETVKRLKRKWDVEDDYFEGAKRIHVKWLLLEHSDVSVPSNVNALNVAVAKGLLLSDDLKEQLGIETEPEGDDCSYDKAEQLVAPNAKPYPNEHACRLKNPDQFDRFRRGSRQHDGKTYHIIFGHPKDSGGWQEQAYRYPKGSWEVAEARAHCRSHDGIAFEPAKEEERDARAGARIRIIRRLKEPERRIVIPETPRRVVTPVVEADVAAIVHEEIEKHRGRL